jgi:hypothetical protein
MRKTRDLFLVFSWQETDGSMKNADHSILRRTRWGREVNDEDILEPGGGLRIGARGGEEATSDTQYNICTAVTARCSEEYESTYYISTICHTRVSNFEIHQICGAEYHSRSHQFCNH